MKIAFGIFKCYPVGGLEKDCLAVAGLLEARGHSVDVFSTTSDPMTAGAPRIRLLASRAWRNHDRDRQFAAAFLEATRNRYDAVVGFNKMPHLDVLYCADPCIASHQLSWPLTWLSRHRTRLAMERSCFAEPGGTRIAVLTETASEQYRSAWGTDARRLTVLAPVFGEGAPAHSAKPATSRARVRASLGLASDDLVWLWIGTQPRTKGLDRVLDALAPHQEANLLVVGPSPDKLGPYRQSVERTGASARIKWLGYRRDVANLMVAADVLVHPARLETTGQVILEALASGLPVIVSGASGYAGHVVRAEAGVVISEPFDAGALRSALYRAASAEQRENWSVAAYKYMAAFPKDSGLVQFADLVEQVGARSAADGAPLQDIMPSVPHARRV